MLRDLLNLGICNRIESAEWLINNKILLLSVLEPSRLALDDLQHNTILARALFRQLSPQAC